MSGIRRFFCRAFGGVADRGHESLLLAGEHGRLRPDRRVAPGPGRSLSQRIEVRRSRLSPDRRSEFAQTRRARFSRDRTVPTGTPSASGDVFVAELLPDEQQQRVAFPLGESGNRVGHPRPQFAGRRGRRRSRRPGPRPAAGARAAGRSHGSGALRCAGGGPASWSRCRTATVGRSAARQSYVARFSNAMRNTSPSNASASSTPTRRTR